MCPRCSYLAIVVLLTGVSAVGAQTSFPMITHIHPVAVQRGQTAEIVVDGKMNFYGAYQVLFEGKGLTAEVLPDAADAKPGVPLPQVSKVKLKVTVAANAPLGVRELRIATKLGISSIGQLLVVDDPVVDESAANNTLAQARSIKLPCVVAGKLEAKEDVDYFKFDARAGETITFELQCARLQDKIHDLQSHAKPMLVLHDSDGRELAANDCFYFADPLLSYTIAKSGVYYVQVRESTYDGDPRWVYALLATQRPYATHVYPSAGKPGQTLTVEPIGVAQQQPMTVTLPMEPGVHLVQGTLGGQASNPVAMIVSDLPQVQEQEPNDDPSKATRIALPCGINGRIGQKRDLDHFIFAAKKGQTIRFEVRARRFGTLLQSSVHAVLEILTPAGVILAGNDDSHGKEAALVFTPGVDSDFILRVRDLNSKGAPTAVYYIEADWALPDFALRCDPDKAMIGPGSSTAWFVHVVRSNGFAGPVDVTVKDLPAGVTCSALTIPPSMTQGALVVTAAADAKIAAANVTVWGRAKLVRAGKEVEAERQVMPNQEIYSPGGGRARFDVSLQTVAVTLPSDILKVEVSQREIVLKPGQEIKLEVTVQRRADFDKGVTLDIPLRHLGSMFGDPLPPGVSIVAGKSKTLLGATSKGHIVLKAADNAAPIENVPICIQAHVSINFVVKTSYTTLPILVSVRK